MHRYDELEKKYYKKLYLKIFFYFLAIITTVTIIVFIKKNVNNSNKNSFKEENISFRQVSKEKNSSVKKIKTIVKKEHKDKKNIKKRIVEELKFILPDVENIKILDIKKNENNQSNFIKKIKKENKTVTEKPLFNLKEVSLDKQDITLLIKSFNQNPDYDLAITIAKYYLNHNNLNQAQIWALKANNLNPEKPDSWLIFANILQKENKIQKAIEVLKVYKNSYGIDKKIEKKLRSLYAK